MNATCLLSPSALRVLAPLVLLAAPATAGVITVAADDSGDFTSINQAIAAAVDGDTLVVRPGSYPSFTLSGTKGLTITSDGTGTVQVNGSIGVANAPEGLTFVFSGLSATGLVGSEGLFQGYGFWAVNCAAAIRVQDCTFTGAAGDPEGWEVDLGYQFQVTGHAAGWHGVLIQNCTKPIAFNDCTIEGGTATYMASYPDPDCGCTYGEPGGDGVRVQTGLVLFSDCDVEAGYGATADRTGGGGGNALSMMAGTAMISGGTWEGGNGGAATDYIGAVFGGDGGDGIFMAPGALVWVRDALTLGGVGGSSLSGNPGAPGQPIVGPAVQYPGQARSVAVSAPSLVGGNLDLTLTGQPGDAALLFVSTGTGVLVSVKFGGSLLAGGATFIVPLGVLPPSGQLVLTSPVPAIAPLLELPVFVQGLMGVPGDAAFTGAATLVLVDPAAL